MGDNDPITVYKMIKKKNFRIKKSNQRDCENKKKKKKKKYTKQNA